jgi:hypothetical protein
MVEQLLQWVNDVLVPALLAVLTCVVGLGVAALKKYLAELSQEKAVQEAVLSVEQTQAEATGAQKMAVVKEVLSDDPRVKVISEGAIEAVVATLPKSGA